MIWREKLGPKDRPYLVRWVLNFGLFSIRIHHWLYSDDLRNPHDHPWWFWTLCLWGRYTDSSENGEDNVKMGSIRFRPARHRHSVKVKKRCWTLLITGPEERVWGFWVKGKFRKRNKYFFEHGHHDPLNPKERWTSGVRRTTAISLKRT